MVSKLSGLYDRDAHLVHPSTLDEAPALFRMATLYALVVWLGESQLIEGPLGKAQVLALWTLLFAAMLVTRAGARRVARGLAAEERCLVLGDAATAQWLADKLMACPSTSIRVAGWVPLEDQDHGPADAPPLGSFDTLGMALAHHEIDRVIITPQTSDAEHMLDAIHVVKALGTKVSVLPRLFEVIGSSVEFDEIDGTTLLGVRPYGLSRSSRVIKRALDVSGAAVGLLLLAPLLLMIATAITLTSSGPVLFRQKRIGKDDVTFGMFKFRTGPTGPSGST